MKIINKKMLIVLVLSTLTTTVFAQNVSQVSNQISNKCVVQNNVNYCSFQAGVNQPQQTVQPIEPIKVANTSTEIVPDVINTQSLTTNMQMPQGQYSTKVPGGNVFLFCGAGRPSRANPLRVVYDSICANNTGTQGQSQVFTQTPQQQPILTDQQPISLSPVTNVNKRINTKAESYNDPIQLLK